MKKKTMDVVFLLDRSGSMSGMENDTIGGYNSYINDFKKKDALITTILFDDKYEMITDRKDVKNVPKLTNKEYFTRGSTALLDAIGKSIKYMEEKKSEKVMFVITTDGYENSSKEFSKEQIRELIQGHNTWEFIYIGADIDSYKEGASIGIRKSNIANYKKTAKGTKNMFGAVLCACEEYCEENYVGTSWKKELEKEE